MSSHRTPDMRLGQDSSPRSLRICWQLPTACFWIAFLFCTSEACSTYSVIVLRMLVCRYGPFWVATTLVFVIAATGNYANYVSYRKKHSAATSTVQVWYSNVDKVTETALHCLLFLCHSLWAEVFGRLLFCFAQPQSGPPCTYAPQCKL